MRYALGLAALLLVAPALAQDDPAEEIVEPGRKPARERLPWEIPTGKLSGKQRNGPAVFVRVKDAGHLQIKEGEDWKDATLESLAAFLHRSKERHHFERRKKGESGYEKTPGGALYSRLFVSIEADPATPWQHVQWLMTIAREQRFLKLELSVGKRRLLAFPPVPGIAPIPPEPPNEIVASVHVVARKEKPAKWGDKSVMRPTTCLYRTGDRTGADLANAKKLLEIGRKHVAGIDAELIGEVKAGLKVPFAKVFPVLELFVDHDITKARFFGTRIPDAQERRAKRLPFPHKNYDTPD